MGLLPNTRLVVCPACAEHIKAQDPSCPHCGRERPQAGTLTAAAVALGLALAGCTSAETKHVEEVKKQPPTQPNVPVAPVEPVRPPDPNMMEAAYGAPVPPHLVPPPVEPEPEPPQSTADPMYGSPPVPKDAPKKEETKKVVKPKPR
jgi:hypothetical protein